MKRALCYCLALTFGHMVMAAGTSPTDGPTDNPPPATALNAFHAYELQDLTLMAPYAGQAANEKAAAKIREHVQAQIAPIVTAWNAAGANSSMKGTLVITPEIEEIKFIGGKARFWAGALAGSSYVVMKLKLTERESGRVIGEPEFFQRAAAMSGAWTVGGQDNDMLQRIVTVASAYLSGNYSAATGGATGRVKK